MSKFDMSTFVNHWNNRKTVPISLYYFLLSILGKRVFVYISTIFNAANTYITPHMIFCSTSSTSFVHVGSISMFTNRPCLGLWTVNVSRRYHSVSSPNVVSGVLGRKYWYQLFIATIILHKHYIFMANTTFNRWFLPSTCVVIWIYIVYHSLRHVRIWPADAPW